MDADRTFESLWNRHPLPAEYDDMDAVAKEQWRNVARAFWQAGAAQPAGVEDASALIRKVGDTPTQNVDYTNGWNDAIRTVQDSAPVAVSPVAEAQGAVRAALQAILADGCVADSETNIAAPLYRQAHEALAALESPAKPPAQAEGV